MYLFIKCLPRMFKQSNRDIKRHISLAFSSSVSIGVALLIAMIMAVFAFNVGNFTTSIESEFIVQVSIQPDTSEEEIESLKKNILKLDHVDSVQFSSKEEELEKLIQENGDVFSEYRNNNPLYDIFIVELDDSSVIDTVNQTIGKYKHVLKTTYGGSIVSKMISLMRVIRKWGYVFVGLFSIFAVFLVRNTVKMTILVRRDEIFIMRTVGAMNWYVTFPFMLEGMITGFVGALIPSIICIFGYPILYKSMNGVLMTDMLQLVKPFPFVFQVSLALFGVGLVVGMLGSSLASRKYLRWTR